MSIDEKNIKFGYIPEVVEKLTEEEIETNYDKHNITKADFKHLLKKV